MKDIGKKLMDIARWYSMPADHFNTMKEAVELLEQKSSYNSIKTELNDDAISRQAAIDAIENEQKKIMRSDWAIDQAKFSAMSEIRELIADLPSVSTEKTGRCKDCQYFQHDSIAIVDGIPLIVAHEICTTWGDGCKTREDGYCFMYTPKVESEDKV